MTIKDVIYPLGNPFSWKVTVHLEESKCARPFLTVAYRDCYYYDLPEWAIKAKVLKVEDVNITRQELDVILEVA